MTSSSARAGEEESSPFRKLSEEENNNEEESPPAPSRPRLRVVLAKPECSDTREKDWTNKTEEVPSNSSDSIMLLIRQHQLQLIIAHPSRLSPPRRLAVFRVAQKSSILLPMDGVAAERMVTDAGGE
jgi:hypothetical protein